MDAGSPPAVRKAWLAAIAANRAAKSADTCLWDVNDGTSAKWDTDQAFETADLALSKARVASDAATEAQADGHLDVAVFASSAASNAAASAAALKKAAFRVQRKTLARRRKLDPSFISDVLDSPLCANNNNGDDNNNSNNNNGDNNNDNNNNDDGNDNNNNNNDDGNNNNNNNNKNSNNHPQTYRRGIR